MRYIVTPTALDIEADTPEEAARIAYRLLANGPADGQTALVWNPPVSVDSKKRDYTSTRWTLTTEPVEIKPEPNPASPASPNQKAS